MKVNESFTLMVVVGFLFLSQYVEFSGLEANDDEDNIPNGGDDGWSLPSPNFRKVAANEGKSLEALLATKNKRLQEELTKLRVG